jgi:tetratricopeptide (TPR) repeat protein
MVRDLALRGRAVEIPLPSLSAAAVEAYLGLRFPGPGLPTGIARAVHRHTEGHPLFLVALAEHWVAHGLLAETGGTWQVRGDPASLERGVPPDVRQMIETRLARLTAEERRLAEAASVAGLEFSAAGVAAAIGESLPDVDERCADLARRGAFLCAHGEERWPDGTLAGRYGFVHAIYRDVIYEQVPAARRADLHRRVALREEAGHGRTAGRIAARLAMHYAQGGDHRAAAHQRLQAARNAAERGGYHEAIAHAEAGLDALGPRPDDHEAKAQAIDLHFELRHALLPLGQHRKILDHLRRAESLAEGLADRGRLGRASAYLTAYFRQAGDLDRSVRCGERALALATAAGDFPLQALANYYLGYACHDLGDYRRAIDCLRHNVASLAGDRLYERFGIPGLVSVLSRSQLSSAAAELGAFAEGAASGEEAVRIADSAEHPFSLTVACFGLGDLSLSQGNLSVATRVLERGLLVCRNASIHTWFPTVATALGHAYALAGRLGEAMPLLRQAVDQADAMPISAIQSRRLAHLSTACMLDGRMEEALALAGRALEVARDLRARGYEAHALRHLGDVQGRQEGPPAKAAEHSYQQALTLAEDLGMRPLAAHCRLGLGRLYRGRGWQAQARAELSAAVDLFRTLDMAFWLARAERERTA